MNVDAFGGFVMDKVARKQVSFPLSDSDLIMLKREFEAKTQAEPEPEPEPEPPSDDEDDERKNTFANSFKNMTFNILSLPVSTEIAKRKELEAKLNNDKYLNKYVDKKLNKYLLKYLNSDVKALMIYGYHFKTTLDN